jgi:hypothetical protein
VVPQGRHRASRRRWNHLTVGALSLAGTLGAAGVVLLLTGGAGTSTGPGTGAGDKPRAAASVLVETRPPHEPSPASSLTERPRPTPSLTPRPKPSAPPIPDDGPGTFAVVAASGEAPEAVEAISYTVELESGLPLRPRAVAGFVDATLADSRGWTSEGDHVLGRVASDPDVRVLVASPGTTDELCAPLDTQGQVSCRNGALVVLNALRWAEGIPDYEGDLLQYRRYLVNHEVGHALGHAHVTCPGPGEPAPVMMQQTYGLEGCSPNPWP